MSRGRRYPLLPVPEGTVALVFEFEDGPPWLYAPVEALGRVIAALVAEGYRRRMAGGSDAVTRRRAIPGEMAVQVAAADSTAASAGQGRSSRS